MENSIYIYKDKIYTKIIFDVGANNGSSTIHLAQNDKNTIVFAFEPTPEMVNVIQSKIEGLDNYVLISKAVSNYNGKSVFNVAGNWDWGCSSLLQFSEKSQTDWPGRTDFSVTNTIEVEVIKLEDFIIENKIPKIDYLHIDTQGSDLNVLIGLGEYKKIVLEGTMEAGTVDDVLYVGQNKLNECVRFLLSNGFSIFDINKNDIFCNEVNISFKRNY